MGVSGRVQGIKLIVGGYLKSFRCKKQESEELPIDFVVTWVDGNDPVWRDERSKVLRIEEKDASGNGVGRYRDWPSFRYWFRAVEKFAPWVRYVHLVTWGHVPQWLKEDCPKLRIVNHKDYIPQEYLPTFNSIPLELNLFRIPGLSENFVYFNDDVLLARPVKPTDFFVNGVPVCTGIATPFINRYGDACTYHLFNAYGAANKKNNIQDCIKRFPHKWFSHHYGYLVKHNIEAWRNAGIAGLYWHHMAVPFCKSSMEKT